MFTIFANVLYSNVLNKNSVRVYNPIGSNFGRIWSDCIGFIHMRTDVLKDTFERILLLLGYPIQRSYRIRLNPVGSILSVESYRILS
jgi:hypothetical protein